jgi:hypothetical protein
VPFQATQVAQPKINRGSQVIQRSNGGGDGGDGGHHLNRANQVLNHLRRLADRVDQYISNNAGRVANVLNSNVDTYNNNPLLGAVVYQLLTGILNELNQLHHTYDTAFEAIQDRYGDDIYEAGLDDLFNDEWRDLLDRHGQAVDYLNEIIAFFQPYQQWVTDHPNNPTNRPLGNGLFPQYNSTLHPSVGSVTQSMQAEDALAAYNLRQMARGPIGPPRWHSGSCGPRRGL